MPFTLADLPFLILLPLLLVASAFFSGSETALFGLSANQRYHLTRHRSLVGRAVEHLLANQSTLLVTLMLGNMTINVLYFVVSSVLLLKINAESQPIVLVVATLIPLIGIIIFGEVLPKLIANTAQVGWIRVCALPLDFAHRLIAPAGIALSRWVVRPLVRLLAPPSPPRELSADEVDALVDMSCSRGIIGTNEQELLGEVLDLSELKVRDVMVPRVDVRSIDVHLPPHRLRELIVETNATKIVAVDGDLDHVEGVIFARQFLLARGLEPNVTLQSLVRQVRFVPEVQRVDQLLEDFRKTGTHMAIVVDEYGGTAGLVTLRDVVQQMLGDIDPTRPPEDALPDAEQLDANTWRLSGRLSVHDWAEAFGAENLPPRVSTVGGLVMAQLRRVPQPGDRARLANLELEVEKAEKGRIASVLLRIISTSIDQEASP
jgi:putative hemolysin